LPVSFSVQIIYRIVSYRVHGFISFFVNRLPFCGHRTGRITRLARPSVCPSVPCGFYVKWLTKVWCDVPRLDYHYTMCTFSV